MVNVGICFSKPLEGTTPLSHITTKNKVYMRLLELMEAKGWEVYVFTRKTYLGDGIFAGAWKYKNSEFKIVPTKIKADLVYDRTGGVEFPPEDDSMKVVNIHSFKKLCWDKWASYTLLHEFMPKTWWVGDESNLTKTINESNLEFLVLKPFNGLKGIGVFVGKKADAEKFKFSSPNSKYILQEFVDTSSGIPGITNGLHDLRVVIVNGKVVWCHVRIPPEGSFRANAATGGTLIEVDYSKVIDSVKKIVTEVMQKFNVQYDNPIFSVDFGIDKDGTPKIFEINDQIGFPTWEMKNRDVFLNELVSNFESKL